MLFLRRTPRPSSTRSRARLTLEVLDARLAPSLIDPITGAEIPAPPPPPTNPPIVGDPTPNPPPPTTPPIVGDPTPPPGTGGNPPLIPLAGNAPPQITHFSAVEIVGGMWRFSGTVVDETPGGLTVTLGGEPDSLQGVTVRTDANGHFEIVLLLNTNGSDNGLASAQTVDGAGLASNVALTNISPG